MRARKKCGSLLESLFPLSYNLKVRLRSQAGAEYKEKSLHCSPLCVASAMEASPLYSYPASSEEGVTQPC